MNYADYGFSYPVLKPNDDSISGKAEIIFPEEIKEGENDYFFKVKFDYDNEDIKKLAESGKAEYVVEVSCSYTFYRKVFKSNEELIEFKIPKSHLKGKVTAECLIVAKEKISGYKNEAAHPDYKDYTFDLDKGSILAYFGEFEFTAHINYKKLKAVTSFMEVVEGKEEFMVVDPDNDKIVVKLPAEDYKLFAQDAISKDKNTSPVIHSSIVLNALLIALYNVEEYKERLWAQSVYYRLKNENELKRFVNDQGQFDKENVPEIAQILLGYPVTRLIKQLEENLQNIEDE